LNDECSQAVSDRWAEYQRFYRAGAAYSALTRLGAIENCLKHGRLSGAVAQKWQTLLRDVPLSDEDLTKARSEAFDTLERLRRMISVGTKFIYEELLWAITMRVELQLLSDFLRSRKVADEIDTAAVDAELRDLGRSKENASAFRNAQNAAKRNWGIPLHTSWLEKL
jgi:hypothetical protein